MASPEAAKWQEAMDSKIQSMKDNQVWTLIDHTPGVKLVGCKWVFKKKTEMDVNVHTFKVRLVAKGYMQRYGVDYDETFVTPRQRRKHGVWQGDMGNTVMA